MDVQAARLRVDARKWAAERMNPKAYGQHMNTHHTGEPQSMRITVELPPQIAPECSETRENSLLPRSTGPDVVDNGG